MTMSIDLNKMPKLGFGLMRLPEKELEECLDLDLLRTALSPVDEHGAQSNHLHIIAQPEQPPGSDEH